MVKGKKGLLSKTTKPIVRRDATALEESIRALEKQIALLKRALKGTAKKKPAKRIRLKSQPVYNCDDGCRGGGGACGRAESSGRCSSGGCRR